MRFFLSLFSIFFGGGRRGCGRKFRVRAGRASWSNRGGARLRTSRHTSVGRSGVRVNAKTGPVRVAAGKTGVRVAAVKTVGPVSITAAKHGVTVTGSVGCGSRPGGGPRKTQAELQREIEQETELARQRQR